MEKHKIDRINELARKKKSDGLTDEEAAEFRDACTPIWYSYEGGKYTDLVDQIQAAAE